MLMLLMHLLKFSSLMPWKVGGGPFFLGSEKVMIDLFAIELSRFALSLDSGSFGFVGFLAYTVS